MEKDERSRRPARNRNVAALLALFGGFVGAHRFYLNQPVWGVIYLLGSWTLIPLFVGWVEGIRFFMWSDQRFGQYLTGDSSSGSDQTSGGASQSDQPHLPTQVEKFRDDYLQDHELLVGWARCAIEESRSSWRRRRRRRRSRGKRTSRRRRLEDGFLCLTDRRVVFIQRRLIGLKIEDVSLGHIIDFHIETGVTRHRLQIHTDDEFLSVIWRDDGEIEQFIAAVKAQIQQFQQRQQAMLGERAEQDSAQSVATQPEPQPAEGPGALEKIEDLARLRDDGVITDAEFERKKAELLEEV